MINKVYKILIVDDEEINLEILRANLESYYDLDATTSIKEALKLIDDNSYDAFLFDINMDEMNGLELCKLVKNYKKYIYTPVVFITVLDDISQIEKGFEYGAYDYITKPVNPKELKVRLNAHIKISKNQIELKEKQLELNKEIENLTNELIETKRNITLNEEIFQNRENKFKDNDNKIKENLNTSIKFDEKISIMQTKLREQKELIERVKKSLS